MKHSDRKDISFQTSNLELFLEDPSIEGEIGSSEKIELLSVELLDQHSSLIKQLKELAQSMKLEFGWHYLLDITWIIQQLGKIKGKKIMDAGAGTGVIQWFLADKGAQVISVDRSSRAALPIRFRTRYHVQGLRNEDLLTSSQVFRSSHSETGKNLASNSIARKIKFQLQIASDYLNWLLISNIKWLDNRNQRGKVYIYNQDLDQLENIEDNSLDAVVAVSALEHNSPEKVQNVIQEIMRVLKPGGLLISTLVAAKNEDWWHEPSSGWCYSEASLRQIFQLSHDVPSNYGEYEEMLQSLRNCDELRDNLAKFYFNSDKNGMPWGIWNPQYIPVGVKKVKQV